MSSKPRVVIVPGVRGDAGGDACDHSTPASGGGGDLMLTVGSLFAGIGGFDLGFHRAGMTTRWMCEIDDHCQAVLRRQFPEGEIYRDVTTLNGCILPPVDVICGGFPCQDLSVAGKRAGFAGARSGLFFQFMRVVREMREATDGVYPGVVVIENVPGLLSSAGGTDFGVLLDTLADLGAVDIGWRILDAQWFGVAQRRRRVFIVADFAGKRAAEILALREGVSAYPAPRRATGERVTGPLADSTGSRGWSSSVDVQAWVPTTGYRLQAFGGYTEDGTDVAILARDAKDAKDLITATLTSNGDAHSGFRAGDGLVITHSLAAEGHDASEDGTGRGTPLVAYGIRGTIASRSAEKGGPNGTGILGGVQCPLNATEQHAVAFPIQNDAYSRSGDASEGIKMPSAGVGIEGEHRFTLDTIKAHAVAFRQRTRPHGQHDVLPAMAVRRLTPAECARLQGFPDDWSAGFADSVQYRMYGNAVCVPVAEWIGRRIVAIANTEVIS